MNNNTTIKGYKEPQSAYNFHKFSLIKTITNFSIGKKSEGEALT